MAQRICFRKTEYPAVFSEYPLIFEENVEIPHETLYGASGRGHTISETLFIDVETLLIDSEAPFIDTKTSLIEFETPFRAGEATLLENVYRVPDRINVFPGYEDLLS